MYAHFQRHVSITLGRRFEEQRRPTCSTVQAESRSLPGAPRSMQIVASTSTLVSESSRRIAYESHRRNMTRRTIKPQVRTNVVDGM